MAIEWDGRERRSAPRVSLEGRLQCRVVMRARVKLLDVSATGALLGTEALLPTGVVAHLSTVLAAGQFMPLIEVVRTNSLGRTQWREFGVQFRAVDERSKRQLDSFLSRASA